MELFRNKVWTWMDIGLLKWSAILFGMIAGAYLSDFVRQHVWYVLSAAVLLAIKPAFTYFAERD